MQSKDLLFEVVGEGIDANPNTLGGNIYAEEAREALGMLRQLIEALEKRAESAEAALKAVLFNTEGTGYTRV